MSADRVFRRGSDVTWRLVSESAGWTYFICGDAAATLDRAASSGGTRALGDGMKAAELIAGIIQIPMDDSVRVGRLQGCGDLPCQGDCRPLRQGAFQRSTSTYSMTSSFGPTS
jgi:hypothetical protein